MEAPQYKQPPLDASFGQLLLQSQQQGIQALQQDVGAQSGRLAARFGTANPTSTGGFLTSHDPGALLAWHGAQLARAGGGLAT
jgi:hypothetical protein